MKGFNYKRRLEIIETVYIEQFKPSLFLFDKGNKELALF